MRATERPVDNALIDATVETLRQHAPFDRMEREHVQWMVGRLALVYFAPQATVLAAVDGVPEHLYILRQGIIAGLDPGDERPRWRLTAGECFPLGALLGKRAVTSLYRTEADSFCWRLPAADFDALLERSGPFHEFCTRRLASLLAVSRRQMQSDYAGSAAQDPLSRPLAQVLRGAAVVCAEDDTLGVALARMQERRVVFPFKVRCDTTPTQLERIPNVVQRLVESHKQARFERSHFHRFGDDSFDFETVYWVTTPDYTLHMDIQQQLHLDLMRELDRLGIALRHSPMIFTSTRLRRLPSNSP